MAPSMPSRGSALTYLPSAAQQACTCSASLQVPIRPRQYTDEYATTERRPLDPLLWRASTGSSREANQGQLPSDEWALELRNQCASSGTAFLFSSAAESTPRLAAMTWLGARGMTCRTTASPIRERAQRLSSRLRPSGRRRRPPCRAARRGGHPPCLQVRGQRFTETWMANWRAGLARRNSPVAAIGSFSYVIMTT
jgi:hypothetical protein